MQIPVGTPLLRVPDLPPAVIIPTLWFKNPAAFSRFVFPSPGALSYPVPKSHGTGIHNWYFRLPPSAFRLPPSAFRLPPSAFRLPPSAFRLPPSAFRPIADAVSPVGPTCWSAVASLPTSAAPPAGTYPAPEFLLPTLASPAPATAGPTDSTDGFLPSPEGLRNSVAGPIPAVESFSPSAAGRRESRSRPPLSPVSVKPLTCLIERS